MAKDQLWMEVTIRVPIDIEHCPTGLVFVTSPFVKGMLIAKGTKDEALARVPQAIQEMAVAIGDSARAGR